MPNYKQDMKATKGNMAAKMTGRAYDAKMAYNKNLKPSARLHYLENERHDATHGSSMSKHMGGRMHKK
jgi:hypothetical protein|tara:strand:+ start:137 stop:340 length:204 start_codon:yes stop_codon:yes gene_type:complete